MFFYLTGLPVRSVQRFEPAGRLDSVLAKNLALRFTLNGGTRRVRHLSTTAIDSYV